MIKCNEIRKKKCDEIEKIQRILTMIKKEKEPEPTFKPNISISSKKKEKNRSVEEFLKDNEQWRKKKKAKGEEFHLKLLTEEMKEHTFHPIIDKNSRKMLKQVIYLDFLSLIYCNFFHYL